MISIKYKTQLLIFCTAILLAGCSISYKFTGASIDYDKVKSITIPEFPNQSLLVNPLLSSEFSEKLRDYFLRQTRLSLVTRNGDLQLEGEITGYDIKPISIQNDATAAQSRLTVTVKARFSNSKDETQNYESTFSAYGDFPSDKSIQEAEQEVLPEIIEQICEQIFNKSVAQW